MPSFWYFIVYPLYEAHNKLKSQEGTVFELDDFHEFLVLFARAWSIISYKIVAKL